MKKVILGIFALVFCLSSFKGMAQDNNPFDEKGKNAYADIMFLVGEIKNGNIKDYNQETLDKYKTKLTSNIDVNVDFVANTFKTLKDPEFNFNNYVSAANISEKSKELLKEINEKFNSLNSSDYEDYAKQSVARVVSDNDISESEKELVLISYSTTNAMRKNGGPCGTEINGKPSPCGATTGMLIGAIGGELLCGPLCSLGGFVIGGVIGSLFDK